jgi:regulator of sigma E protease
MLGGVLVNFLLALLIYILVFFKWGEEYVPVDSIQWGYEFEQELLDLGLKNGDKILALDDKKVERWVAIHHDIVVNEPKVIQVERDGTVMDIQVPEGQTSKLLKLRYGLVPRVPCEVDGLLKGGNMEKAGVQADDRIIAVNGTPSGFTMSLWT